MCFYLFPDCNIFNAKHLYELLIFFLFKILKYSLILFHIIHKMSSYRRLYINFTKNVYENFMIEITNKMFSYVKARSDEYEKNNSQIYMVQNLLQNLNTFIKYSVLLEI